MKPRKGDWIDYFGIWTAINVIVEEAGKDRFIVEDVRGNLLTVEFRGWDRTSVIWGAI